MKNMLILAAGFGIGAVGFFLAQEFDLFSSTKPITASVAAPTEILNQENFNGPNISPEWQWAKGTPDKATLTERPGWLTIRTKGHEGFPGNPQSRNLLQMEINGGDFTVETRLELDEVPDIKNQLANLSFHTENGRWVYFGRYRNQIEIVAGQAGHVNQVNSVHAYHDQPLTLRLVRSGGQYSGFYKFDDSPWNMLTFRKPTMVTGSGKIGLGLRCNVKDESIKAGHFDYVRVDPHADFPVNEAWTDTGPEQLFPKEATEHTFILNGCEDVAFRETIKTNIPGAMTGYRYSLLEKRPWWEYYLKRNFAKLLDPGRTYKVRFWARGIDVQNPDKPIPVVGHVCTNTKKTQYFQSAWATAQVSQNWTQYEFSFMAGFADRSGPEELGFILDENRLGSIVEIAGVTVQGLSRNVSPNGIKKIAELPDRINIRTMPHVVQMLQTRKVPAEYVLATP